jgi:hypothetical protein
MAFTRYHAGAIAAMLAASAHYIANTHAGTWQKAADEGQTFNLRAAPQYVRFGTGNTWVTVLKQAGGPCTPTFFNAVDPAPGQKKQCDVASGPAVVVPPPVTDHHAGLPVDAASLAAAQASLQPGVDTVELDAANPAMHGGVDLSQTFTGRRPQWPDSDYEARFGDFRTNCNTAWIDYTDPIVLNGQVGASHLHEGSGNTKLDAFSVSATIRTRNSPKGSCRGGSINFSGYWVPSMLNGPIGNGSVVVQDQSGDAGWLLYYKPGDAPYWYQGPDVTALPLGLKMVKGTATATARTGLPIFHCVSEFSGAEYPAGNNSDELPENCPATMPGGMPGAGEPVRLWMNIPFDQCWDGVNLDSPDHKSHMTSLVWNQAGYDATKGAGSPGAQQYKCPDDHPIILTKVTIIPIWRIGSYAASTAGWHLASDVYLNSNPTAPHGWTGHADWMNGWDPTIIQQMAERLQQQAAQLRFVHARLGRRKGCP